MNGSIYKMENITKKETEEFLNVSAVVCVLRVNNNLSVDKLVNWFRKDCGDTLNEKLILKNCDALLDKSKCDQELKGQSFQSPFQLLVKKFFHWQG